MINLMPPPEEWAKLTARFKRIFDYRKAIMFLRPSGNQRHNLLKYGGMLLVLTAIFWFAFLGREGGIPFLSGPRYAQAYTLVPDKISQSAAIPVNLPSGVSEETARAQISFRPEIVGVWLTEDVPSQLVYKPNKPLKRNRYYTVTLAMTTGTIGKDFFVTDDPKVLNILPKSGSETHENSRITVIFNRPMVPLTTLDQLANYQIPVEITPATPGRFKWIGTQTLQFQPESALIASANYTVKIMEGFTSLDGLPIAPLEHKFITRPVRYEDISSGDLIYNQPWRVRFNQPVDLERMLSGITMEDTEAKKNIEFEAEYDSREVTDAETGKKTKVADESAILIYQKNDRHGRKRFWDFNRGYYLNIQRVYPKAGDITFDADNGSFRRVTGIIQRVSAFSERSNFAVPDFFDPTGELVIDFYEDINLGASNISADNLARIKYGERCREEASFGDDIECEKEVDKKQINLSFKADKLANSQKIEIKLQSVKNLARLKLNPDPLVVEANVIPEFKLLKTSPEEGATAADITQFIACTTVPLTKPAKEDVKDALRASALYEFKHWQESQRVPPPPAHSDYYFCSPGEFETRIGYGLMPRTPYELAFTFTDHFSRRLEAKRAFTSGEMPSSQLNFYHFQDRYSVTVPDKTTLTYAVENMEYVNMHLCELSARDMLRYLENSPGYWEGPEAVSGCRQTQNRRLELPRRWWIKNYFKVNLQDYISGESGHFLLTFSHPDYREQYGDHRQVHERSFVTITNLSAVEKKVEVQNSPSNEEYRLSDATRHKLSNLYWVTDTRSLKPVPAAQIELYADADGKKIESAGSATTDRQGVARAVPVNKLAGAVVTSGEDSAIIFSDASKLSYGATAYDARRVYLYTDRPIYRPGQEVHIKGLYRIGYDGDYEIPTGVKVPLQVFNAKNQEILNKELEVNEYGTFNTTLTLDSKAALGGYRIVAKGIDSANFDVEEYVPAAFKVDVRSDKEEYVSGDTLTLAVDADYYFGVPVEGGEVEYGIASQNYYFDRYAGTDFDFGSSWYYCYDGCGYGDKFILRNRIPLGADGTAKIIQTLDFKRLFKNEEERKSKIFVFYVTVKNQNGQVVTTQKSLIFHVGEFYLSAQASPSFVGKGQATTVKVKSVDTAGKPRRVGDIAVTVNKVRWVSNKRQEVDGAYYYNYEKRLEPVWRENASTNGSGDWSGEAVINQEGEFEVSVAASDGRGNRVTDTSYLYVYGDEQVEVKPTNDASLEVVAEKSSLSVGDQARLIIKSPYKKAKALITVERGQIYDYRIVDIDGGIYQHSFTVAKQHVPNVVATVVLLSAKPEVKYGEASFSVNTREQDLTIVVRPDKDEYLPGETVNLSFLVSDGRGQPAETELSVAVADLSVLALKGNPKKQPVAFFYAGFPHTIATVSNLKNILHEMEVPTGTKGGGGAEPEDLAKRRRGVFKDTAFWQAVLRTGKDGMARASFTLPDNLTRWQAESVGITQDTRVGAGYAEFTARKQVMVTPLKPRFIVPGDAFSLGAKVFNQTGTSQRFTVKFSSDSLLLAKKEASEQRVWLAAGETKTAYFKVLAPADKLEGQHRFVLTAENKAYGDEVEQTLPITRNDTYEAMATAGTSVDPTAAEYVFVPSGVAPDKGGLTVKHSATLAVFLSDALNSLLGYPYGCSEQVASKLRALAVVRRGLNLKNIGETFTLKEIDFEGKKYSLDQLVEVGLTRLYESQTVGGYFSYYPGGDGDIYLTAYVVNTLKDLEEAGYDINGESLRRAFSAINTSAYSDEFTHSSDLAVLAAHAAFRIGKSGNIHQNLITRVKQILKDDKLLNEQLSTVSLVHLALLLNDQQKIFGRGNRDKIYDILENKITVDSRGAFLPTNERNYLWRYYETTVKDTALLLKALTARGEENQLFDRILRWLILSRSKDGAWGSTNNTMAVIDGFTDYLAWRKENESAFALTVLLNGQEKGSFNYTPETILAQNELEMPMSAFAPDTLNTVSFRKEDKNRRRNPFYYDAALKYFLPIDKIPPRDEGFTIERAFFRRDDSQGKEPVKEARAGEVLRGELKIIVPQGRNFVAIEDFLPAGVELVNFNLATSDASLRAEQEEKEEQKERKRWRTGVVESGAEVLRPDNAELRDDRLFLFNERLAEGEYTYTYFVRVLVPGVFYHLPAVASEMYFPENFGRTSGSYFTVKE